MAKRIVTFGEIMLRLAPEGYLRFFQNDTMQATFGGGEANVAVSLANYGMDASFVTKLPAHAIGQGAVNSLRGLGVDLGLNVGILSLKCCEVNEGFVKVCLMCLEAALEEAALLLGFVGYVHSLFADWAKAVVYDVKRGLLLRNDEDTLVFGYSVCDYVNYGLRFTRSGRSVDNHIAALAYALYYS